MFSCGALVAQLTGNFINITLMLTMSTERFGKVKFMFDIVYNFLPFRIFFDTTQLPLNLNFSANQCAFTKVFESYTEITSVGYPNPSQWNDVCSWSASLSAASSRIPLQFDLIDCVIDVDSNIFIYDGQNSSAKLLV